MPAGRPRIIKSPAEFDRRADAYFAACEEKGEPVLFIGLVLALGFDCKDTMRLYGQREEFISSVKRAMSRVEAEYERRLVSGAIPPAGPIFALKNFDWKDRQEVDVGASAGLSELLKAARERKGNRN